MKQLVRAALGAGLLSVVTLKRATAQTPALPPPPQAQGALQQALQQQPGLADVLRQRIQQSGLTADQIRARLQASGYPSNLLDAYLGAGGPGAAVTQPGATELAAIQALGLPAIVFPAESLPVDTRFIPGRGGSGPRTPVV